MRGYPLSQTLLFDNKDKGIKKIEVQPNYIEKNFLSIEQRSSRQLIDRKKSSFISCASNTTICAEEQFTENLIENSTRQSEFLRVNPSSLVLENKRQPRILNSELVNEGGEIGAGTTGTLETATAETFCRIFKCSACSKEFTRKENLKNHVLSVHMNLKQFECLICNQQFSERANMIVHMRIHDNIKPYKCEICAREFRSKGNYNDHQRRHMNIRRYECNFCDQKYFRKYQLQSHVVARHQTEEHEAIEMAEPFMTFDFKKYSIYKIKEANLGNQYQRVNKHDSIEDQELKQLKQQALEFHFVGYSANKKSTCPQQQQQEILQ
eukprot:403367283